MDLPKTSPLREQQGRIKGLTPWACFRKENLFQPGEQNGYLFLSGLETADAQHPNDECIESRIASIIWQWKFVEPDKRDALIAESRLASLLEFWFPCSELDYTRKRNAWCDGIPLMELSYINRTSFLIVGVGYFPYQLAAFEIEFHFEKRRDKLPRTIVLRLDRIKHIDYQCIFNNKHPENLLNVRPQTNKDWALAVELIEADDANSN